MKRSRLLTINNIRKGWHWTRAINALFCCKKANNV